MFGIFISGPFGVVLGLILGVIVGIKQPQSSVAALLIAALSLATFCLYFSLPKDEYQGFIIDAETISCESPTSIVPSAVERWNNIKGTPEYQLRPEWKNDIARMIETDKGFILRLKVHRRKKIYEQKKPWNRGHIVASSWVPVGVTENYFARDTGGSCADFRVGQRAFYSPIWEESKVSPPDVLPTFLGVHTLQIVPSKFQQSSQATD